MVLKTHSVALKKNKKKNFFLNSNKARAFQSIPFVGKAQLLGDDSKKSDLAETDDIPNYSKD